MPHKYLTTVTKTEHMGRREHTGSKYHRTMMFVMLENYQLESKNTCEETEETEMLIDL